ncbi:MAG: M20/M25/M40 family metallo-hydrolase [Alphaproteobacteria bacterium]|nr:M20/M25/M40 family metallo-hydrolase [Alphaproteobacteria bacterium]
MTLPVDEIQARLRDGFDHSVERLSALLRIPSIGTDPAYQAATREAANWLVRELQEIGFEAGLRETPGQPAVVAHHPGPGGDGPRVLYYGHYDVQPAEPLELWTSPPFEPTLVEGASGTRLVARGAVDDKGQTMTFIEAFRAWKEVHGTLPVAVTVFLEGEEESGSPSLEGFLQAHRHELGADVCIVSDTNMWDSETPALGIMLRGLLYQEITLHGPSQDLHSGLYGGAVPNPLNMLTKILGDLHDRDGRVRIPGFYDELDDLGELEQAWRGLDFDEARFLGHAGLERSVGEAGRTTIERIWSRPTCDLNGVFGGYTGPGAKTVIPAKASAKLSCRLVPGQDVQKIRDGLRAFLEARNPEDCRLEIEDLGAAPALKVSTDSPYLKAAEAALFDVFGRKPILVGMGGSIPAVGAIREHLGIESIMMGFGLDDDRVHAPDEKFELRCFRNGMLSHAVLLGTLADR